MPSEPVFDYSKVKPFGLILVIALTVLTGLLFIFEYRGPSAEQPLVALILQLVFVLATSLFVVIVSAKSYLQSGALNILLISNAILISSIASTLSVVALSPVLSPFLTPNEATAIGNLGILVSSFVLLLSATLTWLNKSPIMPTNRKFILGITFFVSLLLVAILGLSADFDLIPAFLSNNGPTLLRLVVLTLSAIFYFTSALFFSLRFLKTKSDALYWYSLGLILFGLALVAGVLTWQLGDVMNWTSRVALYLASIYFLLAVWRPEEKTSKSYVELWTQAFRIDQKQLASLFANMSESFIYCKIITNDQGKPVDWIFLDINPSYERLTGLEREKIIGKRVTQLFPNENKDPSDWIGKYGEIALTGNPRKFESYRKTLGKWLSVSAYSPKKGFFISIFEDITEQREAQKEVSRVASFPTLNPNPIVEVDFNGNISYINPSATLYLPDITSKGLAHPFLSDWAQVVKSFEGKTRGTYAREVQVIDKWYYQQLYLVPETNLIRIYSINISELKKTEDALLQAQAKLEDYARNLELLVEERTKKIKESEQSYRELYESFGDAFIATDWEFNIIHWNKAAERITGLHTKDALGKKIYDVLPEMLSIDITPYFEALREKKPVRFLMNTLSRETGRPSVFEISTYPATQGIIVIVIDKTEDEETKRLSAVGQTAGMVGHDIRNPLQAIMGDIYLLQSYVDEISSEEEKKSAEELIESINDNIDYINKIVADLQDYARKTKPNFAKVDLKEVIDHAFSTITIPDNINAECNIEPNIPLKADPLYIRRIITNLSINAIQAMPTGGKLRVEAKKKETFVEITVSDTGEGIPKEIQSKLFKPLFTTKSKGQGFGLAVVKKFIEEMGGTIIFESQEGKGTKFIIALPLKR